jgi:hypothetical protein
MQQGGASAGRSSNITKYDTPLVFKKWHFQFDPLVKIGTQKSKYCSIIDLHYQQYDYYEIVLSAPIVIRKPTANVEGIRRISIVCEIGWLIWCVEYLPICRKFLWPSCRLWFDIKARREAYQNS